VLFILILFACSKFFINVNHKHWKQLLLQPHLKEVRNLIECYRIAIANIPLIKKGDDIARILTHSARLSEHDIVVISSTVVFKVAGRAISCKPSIQLKKQSVLL